MNVASTLQTLAQQAGAQIPNTAVSSAVQQLNNLVNNGKPVPKCVPEKPLKFPPDTEKIKQFAKERSETAVRQILAGENIPCVLESAATDIAKLSAQQGIVAWVRSNKALSAFGAIGLFGVGYGVGKLIEGAVSSATKKGGK